MSNGSQADWFKIIISIVMALIIPVLGWSFNQIIETDRDQHAVLARLDSQDDRIDNLAQQLGLIPVPIPVPNDKDRWTGEQEKVSAEHHMKMHLELEKRHKLINDAQDQIIELFWHIHAGDIPKSRNSIKPMHQ